LRSGVGTDFAPAGNEAFEVFTGLKVFAVGEGELVDIGADFEGDAEEGNLLGCDLKGPF